MQFKTLLTCITLHCAVSQALPQEGKQIIAESSIAAPSHLLDNQVPVANWIWDSGPDNPRNCYLLVRKTIELDQVPSDATAYISAFSYADVWINGKLVDRCPMNCDPEFQVYEKFDLSCYFKKGKNTIAAVVYNFGTGMHHRLNGRGGFFFQASLAAGNSGQIRINTDHSWKVNRAEAWDTSSGTRTATSNLIGFIEKFDAGRMPDHWKENSFNDAGWPNARALGVPPVAPWNNLVVISRPPLFREKVYPVNHWFVGDKVVYDFGKEVAGNPVVEIVSGMPGVTLEMGTGERLLPDSAVLYTKRVNFTDFYICKKGQQVWSPLTWRGFRYLSLSRKDDVVVSQVSVINRHYDLTRQGSFECSDPLLNRIWETGNQTILLCAQDTYMDTPWREQTQYIAGDTRYLQKYAYYPFGQSSEFLIRYNILSGAWSQRWRTDGSIRSRYPTDWLLGEGTSAYIPDYEFEWIIMLGEYYRYFGKTDLIRQVYPNMKKLLAGFEKYVGKEHGLLARVPGWIVLDHPDTYPMDQTDEIAGLNCLYYAALSEAATLAETIVQDPEDASKWRMQAARLRDNIRKWLQSPETSLFADSYGSRKYSQQTQVYALLYGLVSDQEKESITRAIAGGNRSSEESFSYYLVYSMFEHHPQWALDFIRTNWGGQMKAPYFNGAWHEAWDIANWTTDLGTTSHAWCSGPTALLPQKILGLEPVAAGWKTFTVRPECCDLKWARGGVTTAYGRIGVEWKKEADESFRLTLNVPENTNAGMVIPGKDISKMNINGVSITKCPAVSKIKQEMGTIRFSLAPGEYRIQSAN